MKINRFLVSLISCAWLLSMLVCPAIRTHGAPVSLWETNLTLPTYLVGPPDPNPRFFQGRAY